MTSMKRVAAAFAAACALIGCALTPQPADAANGSSLSAQYDQARAAAQKAGKHRLVMVGAAMDASSTAFVSDVQLVERQLRAQVPGLMTLRLANGAKRQGLPEVTQRSLRQALLHAGTLVGGEAAPGSLVVVLLTSHGHVGLLSSARYANDSSNVHVSELREWLAPLGETTPTLLIISACYSGSLIPLLEQPNRIIMTAASERTSSFGCHPESRNTYFVEAMFEKGIDTNLNIEQWFERTSKTVAARETEMKLTPPSAPQIWIGSAMKSFAHKPLADVLAPFGPSATR